MRRSRPWALAWLTHALVGVRGVIIHNTRPNPSAPGVVVFTHYDKPDWEAKCGPLMFSLRRAQVDFIIGYLDEATFEGRERRVAECALDPVCVQRERDHVFNNMNKFVWAYDVLTTRAAVHPDSLVVFADCTDAYLMCGAQELERKFIAFNAEVVQSAECVMWPNDGLAKLIARGRANDPYPPAPTPLRYGNTGQYAGRARDLVRYFERQRREWETGTPWTWCCPTLLRYVPATAGMRASNATDCYNDQRCIHTFVAAGFHADGRGPRLVFDTLADLFLNTHKMYNRVAYIGARVAFNMSAALTSRGAETRAQVWAPPRELSRPCWIHFSGSGKRYWPTASARLMGAARREDAARGGGRGGVISLSLAHTNAGIHSTTYRPGGISK
jgi:hypothetical protein